MCQDAKDCEQKVPRCVHETTEFTKMAKFRCILSVFKVRSTETRNMLQQPGGFEALSVDRKYEHSILRTSRPDCRLSNDICRFIEDTQAMA